MKRNALALGVAAAIGMIGAAQAQPIANPNAGTQFKFDRDAVGHVLIGEHVSAANGNGTNINIVNTDSLNGKVVKVRVRSAVNSDDLFDFTLLMSPSDMWTGVITTNPATGRGALVTRDKSCTLPNIGGGKYNDFLTIRLPGSLSASELADWTREGYVEILNMADIPGPGTKVYKEDNARTGDSTLDTQSQGRLFKAVKHVDGVAPCDAGVLSTSAYGSYFKNIKAANERGLDFPTGRLFANMSLVNGTTNMAFSNELSAIRVTDDDGVNAAGHLVWSPQNKGAIAGGADKWTSDPLHRSSLVAGANRILLPGPLGGINIGTLSVEIPLPRVQAYANDMPDLSSPYIGPVGSTTAPLSSVGALMQQLAVTSVSNEFYNNPSYGGATDWTLSNPLRRYQVAMDYEADNLRDDLVTAYDGRVYTLPAGLLGGGPVPADWVQYYDRYNTQLDTRRGKRVCVKTQGMAQWDREETTITDGFDLSPSLPGGLNFCGEVTVLNFGPTFQANGGTAVLGARAAVSSVSTPFTEGWAKINTSNPATNVDGSPMTNERGVAYTRGLPLLGHAYMKAVGVPAAGTTTNYGLSYMHRVERGATFAPVQSEPSAQVRSPG